MTSSFFQESKTSFSSAIGNYSFNLNGLGVQSDGTVSISGGYNVSNNGDASFAYGIQVVSFSNSSISLGSDIINNNDGAIVISANNRLITEVPNPNQQMTSLGPQTVSLRAPGTIESNNNKYFIPNDSNKPTGLLYQLDSEMEENQYSKNYFSLYSNERPQYDITGTLIGNQVIGTSNYFPSNDQLWFDKTENIPYTVAEALDDLIVVIDIKTPQGNRGFQGFQGPQGLQGYQGFQGSQGFQNVLEGVQGSQGFQGFQDSQGSQGFQGFEGSHEGTQGFQGFLGFQSYQGSQGSQGSFGLQGINNIDGFQGFQGFPGFQGSQGSFGLQGFLGFQGSFGFQGFQNVQGSQGSQGLQGNQGFFGNQGSAFEGFQGFQGIQSTQGFQGFIGSQGSRGSQGFTGVQGPNNSQVDYALMTLSNGTTGITFSVTSSGYRELISTFYTPVIVQWVLVTNNSSLFDMSAGNGRITYLGPAGNTFLVTVYVSQNSSQLYGLQLRKRGITVEHTSYSVTSQNSISMFNFPVTDLEPSDWLSIWFRPWSNSGSYNMQIAQVFIRSF